MGREELIVMILKLALEGFKYMGDLQKILERLQAGENVTMEEILKAQEDRKAAVEKLKENIT